MKQRAEGSPKAKVRNQADRLFIVGLVILSGVWNWRYLTTLKLGALDWPKEVFFFSFVKYSLFVQFKLPLSIPFIHRDVFTYPTLSASHSYWANPEVFTFSPFLLLLSIFSVPQFIKIFYFASSLIGCLGSYFLGRRLKFSPIFSFIFAILIALNPWVMQHQAIGYTPFLNALLCPWIVYFLLDPKKQSRSLVGASLLSSLILYQGGLHILVWMFMTFGIYGAIWAIVEWKMIRSKLSFLISYIMLTLALCLPKLFAILSSLQGFRRSIQTSYSNPGELLGLLTNQSLNPFDSAITYRHYNGVPLYDGLLYLGEWFLFLLLLSVSLSFWNPAKKTRRTVFVSLGASVIWVILGKQGVWASLSRFVPVLDCEIYPYRFLFLAALGFIFVVIDQADLLYKTLTGRLKFLPVLCLLPVLVSFYFRNDFFSQAASQKDIFPLVTEYQKYFEDGAKRVLLQSKSGHFNLRPVANDIQIGPDLIQVQYNAPQGSIASVCLKEFRSFRALDYTLSPEAKVTEDPRQDLTCFESIHPDQQFLELRAKDYSMMKLWALAVVLYGVTLFAFRYHKSYQESPQVQCA
jgi:hypothetical protein